MLKNYLNQASLIKELELSTNGISPQKPYLLISKDFDKSFSKSYKMQSNSQITGTLKSKWNAILHN